MKVELILPRKEKTKLVDTGFYVTPLTITQLAAVTPESIELKLTDENLIRADYSWKPDLVGISVMTSQAGRAREISEEYKKKGAKIVWGGIHPTVVDQIENKLIDSFVIGEAEETWPRLLKDFQERKLQRKYQASSPVNLNSIPLPRRDLLMPNVEFLVESIIASRGCCFDCSYCTAQLVYGKKARLISPEKVEQDIARMKSQFGAFVDDNLAIRKDYMKKIFEIAKKFNKRWFTQLDPKSCLDEEIARTMSEAGIRLVLVGFESINSENFARNIKYVAPEHWKQAIGNMHKYNIAVDGNFIVGFDNDKKEVFERTAEAIKKSEMDFASYSILTPYPGTKIFSQLEREGRIFDRNWENYDLHHVTFTPKHMSPEELIRGVTDLRQNSVPLYIQIKNILGR